MAHVFQQTRDKKRLGKAAPWYVEWKDIHGRRHSQKAGPKKTAEKIARRKELELAERRAGIATEKTWKEFRAEYEAIALPRMRSTKSIAAVRVSLNVFEKLARPKTVLGIDRVMLEMFTTARLQMRGQKKGSTLSPHTVRLDLRNIHAVLSYAHQLGYLPAIPSTPKVEAEKEDKDYMRAEHWLQIVKAADQAKAPTGLPNGITAGDWWRALIKVLWVSGSRIGALLSAEWRFVDLDAGLIVLPAKTVKQHRDHIIRVAAAVPELERIQQIADPRVFPWDQSRRTLDDYFHRLQLEAGIYLPCRHEGEHHCTAACHCYGFHSLRYSHATYNAGRVDKRELN